MKALFLPDFSSKNPYQSILAESIADRGVPVKLGKSLLFFPLLGAILWEGKPDLLHIHWTSQFWLRRGVLWSWLGLIRFYLEVILIKRLSIKIVWTVHNLYNHERKLPRLERRANRVLARTVDHMIFHCQAGREDFFQIYHLPQELQHRVSIIPHGHFIGTYENVVSSDIARRRLGLNMQQRLFLFFGLIRPYKGVLKLIEAFKRAAIQDAKLLIVGMPQEEKFRAEIESACDRQPAIDLHLRYLPDPDIQYYLNAADVVVLPFENILTSSSAILAMSFAKAVITARVGCLPEVLNEQGCFFYPAGDLQALQRALIRASQAGKAELAGMGRYNQNIIKGFDWGSVAEETIKVYRQVLFAA